jgi:hypothetical protein
VNFLQIRIKPSSFDQHLNQQQANIFVVLNARLTTSRNRGISSGGF